MRINYKSRITRCLQQFSNVKSVEKVFDKSDRKFSSPLSEELIFANSEARFILEKQRQVREKTNKKRKIFVSNRTNIIATIVAHCGASEI